ncbi:hypothetical protein ACIA8G_35300 [Lentzea sp. NPDC051213]|uniref:hypothetical protein n=1 Tax=Lentzea sp. NPDC051213 TaxID=3364126 RepID=UPI0037992DDA
MRHPRFGRHPQPHTLQQIEILQTWIEQRATAFTTLQANNAAWALRGRRASFGTTYKFLQELRDDGLVHQVNEPDAKTHEWLHVDQISVAPPA